MLNPVDALLAAAERSTGPTGSRGARLLWTERLLIGHGSLTRIDVTTSPPRYVCGPSNTRTTRPGHSVAEATPPRFVLSGRRLGEICTLRICPMWCVCAGKAPRMVRGGTPEQGP